MGYDAMANDTSSAPAAVGRDFGKKKRANRTAKLKQCKRDVRREQWLSQVKNKGSDTTTPPTTPPQIISEGRSIDGEQKPSKMDELELQENCDVESPAHYLGRSPPRKSCLSNNSTNSSGSSVGSYSRSVSDAEEEENGGGGVDDWEAIADALSEAAESDQHNDTATFESETRAVKTPEPTNNEPERTIPRAWRPDDVFRPQSLPNLSRQQSLSGNMERHYAVHRGILSLPPSSCPICYEDLDLTDSSFLPCTCGFHLCLFCHKRILEADGRCPGCRKQYNTSTSREEIGVNIGVPVPSMSYQSYRSFSMSPRY